MNPITRWTRAFSLAMAAVMIGGGIDLSLPFNAAFSAVLGAMYMRATGDPVGGPLVMVFCALTIGAFNGVAVAYLTTLALSRGRASAAVTAQVAAPAGEEGRARVAMGGGPSP